MEVRDRPDRPRRSKSDGAALRFHKAPHRRGSTPENTAQTLVMDIINGVKCLSPTLRLLASQIKPTINHIMNLPEYKDILDCV